MDPLSLATGTVALIGACATVARTFAKIRDLKEAPELIQAVNNEISELQLILADMSDHLERMKSRNGTLLNVDEAVVRLCTSTLGRTQDKILEIDSLVQYKLLKENNETGTRVHRRAFMRHRHKLIRFQAELRESRQRVADISRILEVRHISRLEMIMDDMRAQDLSMVIQGQEEIKRMLNGLVNRQPNVSGVAWVPPQESGLPTSDNGLSSVQVSLSRLRPAMAPTRCTCFPQGGSTLLQTFLGTLFFGYTAAPAMPLNQQPCPSNHQTEIRVAYYFPLWFLKYVFWLQVQFGMAGLSQCSLSFIQVIPQDHVALDMIRFGDIGGIKQLLKSGQLSIKAQLPTGASLLHWSVWSANALSTQFLIENGADMFYESPIYLSAQIAAWDQILMNDESHKYREILGSLFPKPDFEECYNFSLLHQAVLGLVNRSIESVLDEDMDQINATDFYGRTALSWATWRADYRAVKALLSYKPDCSKADRDGTTPLDYASRRSAQCLQLLLQTDVSIHHRHRRTRATPLHLAVMNLKRNYEGIKRVEILVKAGIDVNAQNIDGETALHLGTHSQKPYVKSARYLISHGANPEIYDKRGNNILSKAVGKNYHALIDLVLQEHTDHTEHLDEHGTFMHFAAEIANTDTLYLLAQGRLKRRDINVKNKAGLTPTQLALQRGSVDTNWRDAFFAFLRTIDKDIQLELDTIERFHLSQQGSVESGGSESESDTSDASESDDLDKKKKV